MKAMADKIGAVIMGWSMGKLADRPAAGTNGRFFSVSGDPETARNGWLYYDTVTKWICIYQDWLDWGATSAGISTSVDTGFGSALTIAKFTKLHSRYKVIGDTCHTSYDVDIALTGASDGRFISVTIPVQAVDRATLYTTAQGGPRPAQAWSRIEDGYLKLWSAVPWQTDNNPRQLSFCGEFKVSPPSWLFAPSRPSTESGALASLF